VTKADSKPSGPGLKTLQSKAHFGTIMDGLRWTATIVVAMLGGGLAVCALIALAVLFIGRVAARLFNNDEHD
jgi:hypothetical protein